MRTPLPEPLTPLAASLGLMPLYGDIHNHCGLSYGHGRIEDALARAALQLDFVSITGHAAWPDMPVGIPEVAHIVDFHVKGFAKLRQNWTAHFETLKSFDREGVFSVFPGYEIHSSAHGDYTIVYADCDPAAIEFADSPADLKAALTAAKGDRALAFPHHIGYRQGARGIDPFQTPGLRFAYNDHRSQSGLAAWLSGVREAGGLLPQNIVPVHTGSHRASIQAVAEGHADLAAIDAVTFELARRHEPAAKRVTVLARTPETPGLPYITSAAFAERREDICCAIEDAIGELDDETSEALLIECFRRYDEADYDGIAANWQSVQAAGLARPFMA